MSKKKTPETWAEADLGSICSFVNGRGFKTAEWRTQGLPIIRIQNLNPENPKYREFNYFKGEYDEKILIRDGDLLFCWSGSIGTSFGARIWNGPDGVLNQHIFKVELDPSIDKNFYYYQLENSLSHIEDQAHGGVGLTHITKGKLEKVPFVIPPKAEQSRIVAKIESCFSRIDAIEESVTKAEELLESYRASLLAKAFRGELVAQDPNEEPASRLLERIRAERPNDCTGKKSKKDYLPPITANEIPFQIPKSWSWVRLGEIVTFEGGSQPPKSTFKYKPGPDLIRLVQIRDFKSDNHIVYIPRASCRRFFERTDIMIGRYGPPIFQILRGLEGSYNVALMKAVPSKLVDQEYLYWFLQEPRIQYDVNKKSERSAGQTGVNLDFLNNYVVPLPPLKEQSRIAAIVVRHFEQVSNQLDHAAKIAGLVGLMRSSVLNSAFAGRLVPQDDSEGTGHELLSQLKSAQEVELPKQTKKKGKSKS